MNIDLTDEETAALLRELDGIIASDRYFLSPRVQTLKAIRNKIRPEPPLKATTDAQALRAAASRPPPTRVRSEHAEDRAITAGASC
jgi:hypothetical protein